MTDATAPTPADLSGTAGERMKQLEALGTSPQTAAWLRRQLDAALLAWADDETELDIDREAKTDF